MATDDSVTYTGIDEPINGMFDNEVVDKVTQNKLDDEKRKLAELTPQLQDIVDMITREQQIMVDFVIGYIDNTSESEENVKAELKAAGRYRKYLDELKTKFSLMLQETRR
jgi:hypothetical protein